MRKVGKRIPGAMQKKYISKPVSKRSLAMTLIGFFFILMGFNALGAVLNDFDMAILHEAIPRPVRAALWMGTGFVTIVFSWSRKLQWLAVAFAVIMPMERTFSYMWSTYHHFAPGPPSGSVWSVVEALSWLCFIGLITVIAGWPETEREYVDYE